MRPEPFILWKRASHQPADCQRQFGKRPCAVKPRIVPMMLHNARCDGCHARINILAMRKRLVRTNPYPSIHHAQPIGNRGAGKEVGIVDELAPVREVVHEGREWSVASDQWSVSTTKGATTLPSHLTTSH